MDDNTHAYVRLARTTVERLLSGERTMLMGLDIDSDSTLWGIQRACFVSIKKKNGDLRGCIGTLLPVRDTIDGEIIMNAISAATRDPRFEPLTEGELGDVVFSVDVLSKPELIRDRSGLDPKKYGVIVSKGKGVRRGVLLPDLPGVNSVDEQLRIACQKAGIVGLDGVELERFTVDRYAE